MPSRRAGFGEDQSAPVGLDLTKGYRDYNPALDAAFVKKNIAPYKDAGLSQKLTDFRGQSDQSLYDTAAAAVIKLHKMDGSIGKPPPNPNPNPNPPPNPKPPPNPTPKPQPKPTLTNKQRAIKMKANGLTAAQIAKKLGVSLAKVRQWLGMTGGGTTGGGTPPPTGSGCFVAGTRVATPDGEVAIQNLKPGDKVLCLAPTSEDEATEGEVMELFVHADNDEPRLFIHVGDRMIETTAGHRFYNTGALDYVPASELAPGDTLWGLTEDIPVEDIEHFEDAPVTTVYNLRVHPHPNYFVEGVLVHNAKTGG